MGLSTRVVLMMLVVFCLVKILKEALLPLLLLMDSDFLCWSLLVVVVVVLVVLLLGLEARSFLGSHSLFLIFYMVLLLDFLQVLCSAMVIAFVAGCLVKQCFLVFISFLRCIPTAVTSQFLSCSYFQVSKLVRERNLHH